MAEIAGERAKKAEQQAEREARAEERRRAMEAERQKHLDAMIGKLMDTKHNEKCISPNIISLIGFESAHLYNIV